ncbi:MAG TPA: Stf0 family sulfotransferase [Acidimicrobiia bacterium]|nr:Stf0 family sulfotransferase [Acidimicrobiia bacterium]
MLRHGLDTGWWGVPVTWVLVTRDDHLRQACSLARARQTGWWEAGARDSARPESSPRYDVDLIRESMAEIDAQEIAWDAQFAAQGVEPRRLRYEQIGADYEGSVRAVLTQLGVDATRVPPPQLERQADHLTEEWVRRFEADAD